MNDTPSADCLQLDRVLPDYLAGRLAAADAVALETHAAACARCEAIVERSTRREVAFAPALPPAVREATLGTIDGLSLIHI